MATKPGEIYMIDLGIAGKVRPGLILSREDPRPPRDLILVAPLTTDYEGSEYEVPVGKPKFFRQESWVNLQGIQSMRPAILLRYLGRLDVAAMGRVREALRFTFQMD